MLIIVIMFVAFVVSVVINIPIAIAIGISAFIWALLTPDVSVVMVAQKMYTGLDSFPLLAIPLFMLAGELMNKSTIAKRLIDFSDVLVGSFKGGLAHVNVLVSMFFAGMTGSSTSDTSAIGSLLIPAMVKEGYETDISVAVTATSSVIGVIIPPSILIIFYAITMELSVAGMFISGVFPGILLGFALMGVNVYFAHKRNYKAHLRPSLKDAFKILKRAVLSLFVAVIIVIGIYGGIFTPTEAAAVATVYLLFLAVVIYREIKINELYSVFLKSAVVMAVATFLIPASVAFSWAVAVEQLPEKLVGLVLGITQNKIIILLLINFVLLIVGMLTPGLVSILIFAPVLAPIGHALGMHPFHFGMMFVLNTAIGFVTPPVGPCLYVACAISKMEMSETLSAVVPYFLVSLAALMLVTFIPFLTIWLPNVIMGS
jgi:C4-dicarboxylate transporter DctM subunit